MGWFIFGLDFNKQYDIIKMKSYTLKEVKENLYKKHGNNVILVESTYIDMQTKCKFIDKKYGEFDSFPGNVINKGCRHKNEKPVRQRETFLKIYGVDNPNKCERVRQKINKTCLKKYGCINPQQNLSVQEKTQKTNIVKYGVPYLSQNRIIALKQALSSNNGGIVKYWLNEAQLIYRGSFEKVFLEWINLNKYHIKWQVLFNMENGKTYTIDCYIEELDLYIEIKGYFRKDAKEKWEWFHKNHPNSELWDKKKLKELNILK